MRLRNLGVTVCLLGLVATACAGGQAHRISAVVPPPRPLRILTKAPPAHPSPPPTPAPPTARTAGLALTPFASCPAFLAAVRSEAAAEVTPYGLPQWMGMPGGPQMGMGRAGTMAGAAGMAPDAAASSAAPVAAAPTASSSFSTTNNQEAGVDEMDTAKTDGRLVVALREGASGPQLEVTDVSTSPARLRSSTPVDGGYGGGLFLVGSDAVVIGADQNATTVRVYSLAHPDQPRLVRTFSVTGQQVAARLVGPDIKLVVSSLPSIVFPPPDPQPAASGAALARNKAIIAAAPLSAWLPSVTDAHGAKHAAACGAVSHPAERSGVATISVLSIDPEQDQPATPVTVLGDPGIVYASTSELYVATTSFDQQQALTESRRMPDAKTLIHQFDITGSGPAVYRGSGTVPGQILNQYALSELNGDLRVATTTGTPQPPPFEGGPVPPADGSESFVTVLRPRGGALVTIGQVGGLGRTERIYGVRFVGTLGYVVTFRQMDPLSIVDLSTPTAPVVKGALELTGYSAYLHPVDRNRLLGIGASATSTGRRLGLQVSLFDVADPAHPALVGQAQLASASAGVENDPHAFLWWAPSGIAVLPVQVCCDGSTSFTGAVVYRVGTSSVSEVARISQPAGPTPRRDGPAASGSPVGGGGAPIERVFVVGDHLISLSEAGVLTSDLATYAPVSWVPYP